MLAILLVCLSIGMTTVSAQQEDESQASEVAGEIVDTTVDAAEETATIAEQLIDRMTTTPQSDVGRVLIVLGGIVLLVAGWYVYDFVVMIAGFLVGATVAASLIATESTLLALAFMLIGGLIGVMVASFLYYVAVFVIGGYVGIVLTSSAASALSLTPVSPLVLLLGAVIGGLLLLALSFQLLVVLAAIVGAQMVVLGLGLQPVWILILAILGIFVQFALARNFNYSVRRRPTNNRQLFA